MDDNVVLLPNVMIINNKSNHLIANHLKCVNEGRANTGSLIASYCRSTLYNFFVLLFCLLCLK